MLFALCGKIDACLNEVDRLEKPQDEPQNQYCDRKPSFLKAVLYPLRLKRREKNHWNALNIVCNSTVIIHRNLQNLFSLFDEGKFVGFTTTFSLVRLVHLVALISPVSLFYFLLPSWSHCSGLVCLSYLVRSNWLLWIGSFYCRDLSSLISLDFISCCLAGLTARGWFVCLT
jgi:hypothetical protein